MLGVGAVVFLFRSFFKNTGTTGRGDTGWRGHVLLHSGCSYRSCLGRDVVMSKLKHLVLDAQRARQWSSGRGVVAGT